MYLPYSSALPIFGQDSSMASAGLAGVSGAACPLMRLVTMSSVPILQQLHLEERLLRCTPDNWCIINDGTAPATIVMGVSGYKLNSSRILSGRMIQSCISPLVDLLIWFCVMAGEFQSLSRYSLSFGTRCQS